MGDFLDKLDARLSLRAGLEKVGILTAGTANLQNLGPEHMVFAYDDVHNEYAYKIGTPMSRIQEEYNVPGYIWVARPIPPTSNEKAAAKAARDRASEIFRELLDELNFCNTPNGVLNATEHTIDTLGVNDARLMTLIMRQAINDEPFARICELRFTIRVRADFEPEP
jgi:hypothetical protein